MYFNTAVPNCKPVTIGIARIITAVTPLILFAFCGEFLEAK